MQQRVMAVFHYALLTSGFLLLGTSETASTAEDLFTPVDKKHRIYLKRPTAAPALLGFGAPRARGREGQEGRPVAAKPGPREELPREADRILLARYAPAGVIVDEKDDIVEFRGETEPYLEHAQWAREPQPVQDGAQGTPPRDPPGDPGSPQDERARHARRACRCVTGATSAGWIWRWCRCADLPRRTARCSCSSRRAPSPGARAAGARSGGRAWTAPRPRRARSPEARARRGDAVPSGRDAAARGGQRGAAGLERGGPFGQRGAAEHQRGAGDGEGGAAGEQRGAGDAQPGAAGPEPPARARARVRERDRGDGAQSAADPGRRPARGAGESELLRLLPGHARGDGREARLRAGRRAVGHSRAAADAGRDPPRRRPASRTSRSSTSSRGSGVGR